MTTRKNIRRPLAAAGTNQEILGFLFQDHPLPVWVYDLETLAFLDVNRSAVELYGYSREEFLALSLKDVCLFDDVKTLPGIASVDPPECSRPACLQQRLKSGRIIDVEVSTRTTTYRRRKAALVVCRDVTDRRREEEALRESEERYRALFTLSPDPLYVHVDRIVTLVNPAMCRMLGAANPSQLIGKSVFDIVHPDFHRTLLDRWNLVFSGQPAPLLREQFVRLDGGVVDVEVSAVAIDWQGSKGVQVIARDITERRQAEEVARESEERFRMVFEHVFDGICIYSEDPDPARRRLIECNDRYAELAGRSREELLTRGATQDLQINHGHEANIDRLKSLTRGMAYRGSFSWIRPDGRENFIEYVGTPITWRGKSYSIGIDRDVTERRNAEQSQLLLTTALESTPNGAVITDIHGNIEWVNKAFTKMTGYALEEARGRNPRMLKSGRMDASLYAGLWETICAGNAWQGELVNRKKDGSLYTEDMTITPVKRADGAVTHFIAIQQDITERKHSEQALRLMAQTVASVRDCISITDLDNRFLFVNDAFCSVYGYSTEELLGRDVSVLRSPDSLFPPVVDVRGETFGGGWHGELVNRRKDGRDFPVELWTSVVKDDAGTPVALVGLARDITERKTADEHLRQSEEQFRLIAENVADMIALLDLNGRRIYASPSYGPILGDPASLVGTDTFQDVHPDDRDRIRIAFQEMVASGIGRRVEYRFLLKNGTVRDIDTKASVIRDEKGKISRVLVVSRDVTEEKRLAAQFLRAQRMESIGTLAGGIAHDLNNVLSPILMAIEVLRKRVQDPRGLKNLDTIETLAKRGSDIVRQVLAFGRGMKGDRTLVQLRHVVKEVGKIAAETFPKSIDIQLDLAGDLWTVWADPTQMHQVILNMMVNARDAMTGGGVLVVSAGNYSVDENYASTHLGSRPGTFVCVAITDTGTGIPSEIHEKIFEPFFTTKEIGMGTGLGLSTTLAIVKSHEGFITLESEPGKGTTFRIFIPATGSGLDVEKAAGEADPPRGNGELILVLDDEEAIREITKETLEAYGYRVLSACDGAEGISLFSANLDDVSAVITDIMMPVMDGKSAITALHRMKPDVRIIAVSGLTTAWEISGDPDPGVREFLKKPFTAHRLLTALASALR